ncbi:BTAD domain-containing putative transcriptional regulator [Streptomyces sp. NPDC087422]|uniref:AfsR/SARP family transcriptional regulator n=1 Tax=Streptomyces sp. NPDC087422 TaxID=3365786 RepID=UPI0038081A38
MEFCILGHLEVSANGRPVQLGGARERTVLAMLLIEAGHVIPVERLIDAVWGDDPPATSRGQIQICISNLRRRILAGGGEDLIETRRPGYLLRVPAGTLDLHRFEAEVHEGQAALAAGDPAGSARILRDALQLWRGPALADVDSTLVQQGVGRLNERRLAVLGESLKSGLIAGEQHRLIGELTSLAAEYPLHEHFRALLMIALYAAGRQAEALDAYRKVREELQSELGIDPGSELRGLHRAMLAGTFSLPGAEPDETTSGRSTSRDSRDHDGQGRQPQHREDQRRDDQHRDDQRREDQRRDEQRRDDQRRDDQRRDDPRRDDYRRDERRRDEQRRDEHGRDEHGRDDPRRDDYRADEHRRDEPRRDQWDRMERDRDDRYGDRDDPTGSAPAESARPPTSTGAPMPGARADPEGASDQARGQAEGQSPHQPPAEEPKRRAPSLLPADIPDFTSRSETVNDIVRQIGGDQRHRSDQAVPVCVIVGQGGAGKTTLAVHVAHLLTQDFPDGQLFAHLRVGDRPANPSDILERFLRALGVVGPSLPKSLEERAELFRDLVSGRHVLVVLDDAMTERQVTWLLPGSADCSVIVTSRQRLTGLPTAGRVEIGALSESGAAALLARYIGEARVVAEAESVTELSQLCGRLPLALRISAARLAARPHWSVADLVDRLLDESRRLDELNHGEMQVRASISLTYDSLPDDARLLFRRLALLDVPNFAAWVGSPLLQVDVLRAQEALEVLAEAYLIDATPGPGGHVRYSFHDIMRPFAQERLAEESSEERLGALERWLGALLSLTGEAHRREYAGGYLERRSSAERWRLPDRLVERLLSDPLAWYEQERTSIVAAVRQASAAGLVEHCWDLALSSVTLFEAYSYFGNWRETHEIALKAACRAGDQHGEAAMRYSLGSLHMFEQSTDPAMRQFERAHTLYHELGDEHGAALVLRNMAYLDRLTGDIASAQERWEEALGVFQVTGDRIAEAHVLHNMAQVHVDCGETATALRLLERAEAICHEVGNRRVTAQVQNRLGALHLRVGRLDDAHVAYTRVLDSVRVTGDKVGECYALLGLATVDLRRGEPGSARAMLTEALELAVQAGARMVESRIALALAEALLTSDVEAAPEYVERALTGFEAIGATLDKARAMVLRGRVHAASGRPQGARADWQAAAGMLTGLRTDKGGVALVEEVRRLLRTLADGGADAGVAAAQLPAEAELHS